MNHQWFLSKVVLIVTRSHELDPFTLKMSFGTETSGLNSEGFLNLSGLYSGTLLHKITIYEYFVPIYVM